MTTERQRVRTVGDGAARVRPAQPDEYGAILDLAGQQATRMVAATIRHDPRFRPEHLRVVEHEGAVAGAVLVVDRTLRVGTAQARCAIVVAIALDLADVAEGRVGALMRDTLEWATTAGYQLSLLWGQSWPQPYAGYTPGFRRSRVLLRADAQPVGSHGYTLRPATTADVPALAMCYHQATATTTLAEIRSGDPWEWQPTDVEQQVEVVLDPLGVVCGYFRATSADEHLLVHEIAAGNDAAAAALFDRLIERGQAAGDAVQVRATLDNPWSRWALLHGATLVVDSARVQGLVRVLDLLGLLGAIRPELERRVNRSEYACRTARLRLETPAGTAGLLIDRGRVTLADGRSGALVTLPWAALGALAVGYRSVESLVGQPGVRIEGEGTARLLEILFPEGYPEWGEPAYF